MRARGDRTPVLVATARDAVAQRIADLDAGADDCIVEPCALDELRARIHARLRRDAGRAEPVYTHGGVAIQPATREVTVDRTLVVLTARKWAVLAPLIARPGALLSRAQIEE